MGADKQAILVVSFGTSYEETRKKTIDQIENDIRRSYPACPVYRAWTSPRIRAKVEKRDQIHIMDVREAMEQIKADGIRRVIVQPTYVITGLESDAMKKNVLSFRDDFDSISICDSLIVSYADKKNVCRIMTEEYHPAEDEVILFMGHGTEHTANEIYKEMDYIFKRDGHPNMYMGTVEGDFSISRFLSEIKNLHPKKILLAPFMIVAGDHATNDMSGNDEDSWKSILEKEGYPVSCCLKGLGEIPAIREIFIQHIHTAM